MFKFGRWFTYSTPEEKKEHERAYFRSVFPFGEPQKQQEEAFLKRYVQAPVTENEKMYQLLLAKKLYSQENPAALEDGLVKWYRAPLLRKWPDPARAALLSLARLSQEAETFETLPDAQRILSDAAEIEKSLLPGLKKTKKHLWIW